MPPSESSIAAMHSADFYPHPCQGVTAIETHVSWVFLTGTWAYKVKKPIVNPFLDYRSLADRKRFCEAELRLNQRWAPEIYDSVVPIFQSDAGFNLVAGEIVDYAVRMHQFPQESLFLQLVQQRKLTARQVEELGQELARIHASAAKLDPDRQPWASATQIGQDARDNFRDLRKDLPAEEQPLIERLSDWSEREWLRLSPLFEIRRTGGAVRECHGDLHLGNLIWWQDRVQLFDGIEFNEAFRWIDVASDLAFALMDLEEHGEAGLANRLLNAYLTEAGDVPLLELVTFYKLYRAMVRAKTSALNARQHAHEATTYASFRKAAGTYLAYGKKLTAPRHPQLVITCGLSGSGKSFHTELLLDLPHLIRFRTDVERKRLAPTPVPPGNSGGVAKGAYSPEATRKNYEQVAHRAEQTLRSGYSVLVDATFLLACERKRFHDLAKALAVPFSILEFQADLETLQKRIRARAAEGKDPSEATLDVLHWQVEHFQPLTNAELQQRKTMAEVRTALQTQSDSF